MCSAVSPGPSISAAEPVLIFDLDGTLLAINSFPHWVRYLLHGRFGMGCGPRLRLSARVLVLMLRRKLFGLGHLETKRRLQRLWSETSTQDALGQEGLTQQLQAALRPQFSRLLEEIRSGKRDVILATAAADEYARHLGERLGFRYILTTPSRAEGEKPENSREEKRDRVLALLEALHWQDRPRIFFTDHEEDLPLIRASARSYWLGPEEKLAMIRREAPESEVIPALAMDARALYADVFGINS